MILLYVNIFVFVQNPRKSLLFKVPYRVAIGPQLIHDLWVLVLIPEYRE